MLFPLDAELSHWRRTIRWSFHRPSRFPQPSKACFSLEKRGNKKGEFMVKKGEFMVKKVDWCRTDVELRGQNEVFPRRIMIGPGKIMFIQATLWCIQERMWLQGEHWTQRIRQTKGFVCDANVIHDGLSGDFLNKMQWARQTFFYILKN